MDFDATFSTVPNSCNLHFTQLVETDRDVVHFIAAIIIHLEATLSELGHSHAIVAEEFLTAIPSPQRTNFQAQLFPSE
jgi:hypothetical protein